MDSDLVAISEGSEAVALVDLHRRVSYVDYVCQQIVVDVGAVSDSTAEADKSGLPPRTLALKVCQLCPYLSILDSAKPMMGLHDYMKCARRLGYGAKSTCQDRGSRRMEVLADAAPTVQRPLAVVRVSFVATARRHYLA